MTTMTAPVLSLPQKLRYGAEAALFLAFMGFFRLIGLDAASAVGGFIGRNIFARTRVTGRARATISPWPFPKNRPPSAKPSSAPCGTIWAARWRNMPISTNSTFMDADPRIRVENAAEVEKIRGQGVLILSGHFANWEIMPIAAAPVRAGRRHRLSPAQQSLCRPLDCAGAGEERLCRADQQASTARRRFHPAARRQGDSAAGRPEDQ